MSPALTMIRAVWHGGRSPGYPNSWEHLNQSISGALSLAITSGLCFDPEDIGEVFRKGRVAGDADAYHTLAVKSGNRSAADSFDRMRHRKPLTIGKRFPFNPGRCHLRRVFVGVWLDWQGDNVQVTSFADDGESVIACAYHPYEVGKPTRIRRRYTITRRDLNPPKPPAESEAAQAPTEAP